MNRKIIVAVVVITGAGIMNAVFSTPARPLTPVIIGSYVFLFVLSVLDMYGGPMSTLAGALAMLAVTYVLLTEVPWGTIISMLQGRGGASGAKGSVASFNVLPEPHTPGSSH